VDEHTPNVNDSTRQLAYAGRDDGRGDMGTGLRGAGVRDNRDLQHHDAVDGKLDKRSRS
jgi:hypothetical protein